MHYKYIQKKKKMKKKAYCRKGCGWGFNNFIINGLNINGSRGYWHCSDWRPLLVPRISGWCIIEIQVQNCLPSPTAPCIPQWNFSYPTSAHDVSTSMRSLSKTKTILFSNILMLQKQRKNRTKAKILNHRKKKSEILFFFILPPFFVNQTGANLSCSKTLSIKHEEFSI